MGHWKIIRLQWLFHEWAWYLYKRGLQWSLLAPSTTWGISRRCFACEWLSLNELDLEIQAHETMGKTFLLLIKFLVKGMLLGQPEWTKKQLLWDGGAGATKWLLLFPWNRAFHPMKLIPPRSWEAHPSGSHLLSSYVGRHSHIVIC